MFGFWAAAAWSIATVASDSRRPVRRRAAFIMLQVKAGQVRSGNAKACLKIVRHVFEGTAALPNGARPSSSISKPAYDAVEWSTKRE